MEKIYTIEEAKKKMERSVKYYSDRIKAWEKVKRLYKKDGGNFAILSKNFENCRFTNQYGDNYIVVDLKEFTGNYDTDELSLSANRYANLEEATTPEDIEERITALIANYKAWEATDKRGLDSIEKQLNDIEPHLIALKKAIEEAKDTNTHYTMQSYIKNYLRLLND